MSEVVETKEKDTKALVKKILSIAGNVVFYAVIIALFIFSLMNINAGSKNGGFPSIFGRGFFAVKSDSMKHNGVNDLPASYLEYEIGEIVTYDLCNEKVIHKSNATKLNQKALNNLKIGDVCTFYDEVIKDMNTHRIVYMVRDDDGNVTSIAFQGDRSVMDNGVYDPTNPSMTQTNNNLLGKNDVQSLSGDKLLNIKGIVTSVQPNGGRFLLWVHEGYNWLFVFVFPVALLLIVEVFFVIKNLLDYKNEKQRALLASDKDTMMAELEAEKEKMRQELLAELKAQQAASTPETKPTEAEESAVEPVVEETTAEEAAEETPVEEPAEEAVEVETKEE